jgi:hypothetical protein
MIDGVVKLLNALNPPKPKKQPKPIEAPVAKAVEAPQVVAPIAQEVKPNVKQ